jgi:hypothetical protein
MTTTTRTAIHMPMGMKRINTMNRLRLQVLRRPRITTTGWIPV